MAFIINTSKIRKRDTSYYNTSKKTAFKKGGRYGYFQEGGEMMEEDMMEDPAMMGGEGMEGMEGMEEGGMPNEEGNPQDTIQQMQTLLSELIGDPGLEELAQMAEGNPTLQNMLQVIAMLSTVMNISPAETEATEEPMDMGEEDMPPMDDMGDMDMEGMDDADMDEMMS